VAEFKNLEITLPNKIFVHGEMKNQLICGDATAIHIKVICLPIACSKMYSLKYTEV
jgi:hypothetical protein